MDVRSSIYEQAADFVSVLVEAADGARPDNKAVL
jgi:hypothetical protein